LEVVGQNWLHNDGHKADGCDRFARHTSDAVVDTDRRWTKSETAQFPPSLIVTPSTSIEFSGPPGGPFSPSRIEYRVSASTGAVKYSIRTPSWLTASSTFGATDTRGVTITLTVNASALSLPPRAYGPAVAFTNVSNGNQVREVDRSGAFDFSLDSPNRA
jgi:hypothetical protein